MTFSDIKPGVLLTWHPRPHVIRLAGDARKTGETFIILDQSKKNKNDGYWRVLNSQGRIHAWRDKDIVKYLQVVSDS